MKVVLIVIDGFGIGAMPDADKFGDKGSNTYLNILNKTNVKLKNFAKLGLNHIDGIEMSTAKTIGNFGRLTELTNAKDTTAGHYEICGIVLQDPYPTFPKGFPHELIEQLQQGLGVQFIGNEVASGTEIIERLGQTHINERKPILYTSADSVLQIATHTDVFSLEELYDLCFRAREICTDKYNIGRIIARPFATDKSGKFYRLEARKDFALAPPSDTLLDKLKSNGFDTICIGKIADVFCHKGITESYHTKNNTEGILELIIQTKRKINGLIFANLNDTDSLYGHRNDALGYAKALEQIDANLPKIIKNLGKQDILIITADHGCDPTTPSTDHSREYVPLLVYGKSLKQNINLGTKAGFNNISSAILDLFDIEKKDNFLRLLNKNL